jgi:hypothetical protein
MEPPRGLARAARGLRRVDRVARAVAGFAAAATLGAAILGAGCTSSTAASFYTPYTGIRISSAVVFAGKTCGVGRGQVYAYVAVVSEAIDSGPQPSGLPVANVYACGADGAFQNLPGDGVYSVSIYAYDFASYPGDAAELGCLPGACLLMGSPTSAQLGNPTWTTTCMGIQVDFQNPLVYCQPLTPTSNATMPDASLAPESDGGDGGGAGDAGAVDATLGGDGGTADATVDASDGSTDGGGTDIDGGGSDDSDGGPADSADTADAADASDETSDGSDGM